MNLSAAPAETTAPERVEILLVDDREENLLALEAVLKSPGYELVKAESGEAALRYLLDHSPALILMDVQMPQIDGFATAAIIKGSPRTRDIPIIFLTAIGREERFVHKGYEHGAVDYMAKPFDSHILRSKVAVFADLFRKTESLLKAERRLRESDRRDRERKMAELELKSLRREQLEQKKYRDLVEGLENGIVWAADADSLKMNFVSQPAERLLGFGPERWLVEENFWLNHLPEEDRASFRAAVRRLGRDGGHAEFEHRMVSALGDTLWFQTSLRREPGERDIRGLSVDITQNKEASHLLELSKKRSDLLARVGQIMASSFNYETTLPELAGSLVVNHVDWAAIEILRADSTRETIAVAHKDPLILRRARTLAPKWKSETLHPVPGNYKNLNEQSAAQLNISEEQFNFLQTIHANSFIILPLAVREKTIGYLTVAQETGVFSDADLELARDLAFRIAAGVDNWRLYQEAQAAIRIRDEFLSIASHELKTPLTPLKIQTQQLLRLLAKDSLQNVEHERVERMLKTSNRQIERLSKLIDDLLDISRISTGKLQLQIEEFDLMEMIQDIRQRFASQLTSANCELEIEGPKKLSVHWDVFRTEQVIVNLLTNAMKYGPGKPIKISVRSHHDMVKLSVKDGGIGIAAEDQKRIFLRFERAVSSTHFGGLGLGLYIVTQILDAHGGKINVTSEVENGAIFSVEIPARVKEKNKISADNLPFLGSVACP